MRANSGRIEWPAIVRFYERLNRISPTLGRPNRMCRHPCGDEWTGTEACNSGRNRFKLDLSLSTLLGGPRLPPAETWEGP